MARICYILRGLPGTGKSTLAHHLKTNMEDVCEIFSTDDLFMIDGKYRFDISKLREYHLKNLQNVGEFMRRTDRQDLKHSICIVDNTNTRHCEYEKYVKMAERFDFRVQVISIAWDESDIPLYAERNLHGVPEEKIRCMANRWEY